MHVKILLLFTVIFFWTKETGAISNKTFPDYFKFGVATSSYQVEGGWNADGKGESIWDHLCHTNPSFIANEDNGDIACDSYHKYKDDVLMLKNLSVDYYRFSLSWPRIIPLGLAGSPVNQAGIDYYRNLLQELLDNNIEPLVTIFHWDTPQQVENCGGFPNPEIIEHFAYYARVVFENLGDLVKYWSTFNEPMQICPGGYGNGFLAPGHHSSGLADYKCGHNVIKAHAKAYHIYDEEFRQKQNGFVGMVVDTGWMEPASDSVEDQEASERALQFSYGWFINPIVNGNYPSVMLDRIDKRSEQQGFTISRLPKFSEDESEYIKGTYDYLAFNTYSTAIVEAVLEEPDVNIISYDTDLNVKKSFPTSELLAWGIRKLLNWISETYNNPEIFITENGYADEGGLDDDKRINYYQEYLSNILEAVVEDGVNVTRYTAWSLMDNFEWDRGYSVKFGLYSVDFDDPDRPRTPKASASYYNQVITTRCLVDKCVD